MTVPNSSFCGYLRETGVASADEVLSLWHTVITGLSGLDENLVRPVEQQEPPPTPGRSVNWIAFDVAPGAPAYNLPEIKHYKDIEGHDIIIEHKPEDVRVYCYGKEASETADRLRRGLHVGQNRDELFLAGIGIQQIGAPVQVPLLQNQKWIQRYDLIINSVREIRGRYEVLNLLSAHGVIKTDITHGAKKPLERKFDTDWHLKG